MRALASCWDGREASGCCELAMNEGRKWRHRVVSSLNHDLNLQLYNIKARKGGDIDTGQSLVVVVLFFPFSNMYFIF